MSALPPCPKCNSEYTYEDGANYVCPECAHEWSAQAGAEAAEEGPKVYRDSTGTVLQDGDTVTVIKDLKLKGGGGTVKELGGNGGPEYLADCKNIACNGVVKTARPTSSPNPPPRRSERSQIAF